MALSLAAQEVSLPHVSLSTYGLLISVILPVVTYRACLCIIYDCVVAWAGEEHCIIRCERVAGGVFQGCQLC